MKRKLKIQFTLAVGMAIFQTLARALTMVQSEKFQPTNNPFFWVFCVLNFLINLTGTYPIIMAVTYAFILHNLESLCLTLETFCRLTSELAPTSSSALDRHLDLGLGIEDVLDRANECFGMALIFDYGLTLYSVIFAAFFGSLTFTAFAGDRFQALVFWYGMKAFLWTIFVCHRLHSLDRVGQRLTDLANETGRQVQSLRMRSRALFDVTTEAKSDTLFDRLTVSAVIRPLDVFDMGYSTSLNAMTMLVTNIFVLLQFKTGE